MRPQVYADCARNGLLREESEATTIRRCQAGDR